MSCIMVEVHAVFLSCRPPVVGVLGCMAERLKIKLLESDRLVDLVAGPDAYRDIPRLLDTIEVPRPIYA